MAIHIRIEQLPDHPLVLRLVLGRVSLEKFDASLAQGNGYLYTSRLSSGQKNIDAIQIKNGRTYAIKTVGRIPQTTSNIWAASPEEAVDDYVVVLIDHDTLQPKCVMRMSARKVASHFRSDKYQGSKKLSITMDFVEQADILIGERPT